MHDVFPLVVRDSMPSPLPPSGALGATHPATESVPDDDTAELLPIKLTPGFIAVAFHVGCINCNFCCVATNATRQALFRNQAHFSYPTSPADVLDFLRLMPSFREARVQLGSGTTLTTRSNAPKRAT